MVAHSLGKGEVAGSIPAISTKKYAPGTAVKSLSIIFCSTLGFSFSAFGEMDIILVFETSGGSSILSGPATKYCYEHEII